jgi:protein FAM32A
MPSDEYSSVARGPLKLKGAGGVTKKKKKKDKDRNKTTDLEKNLSTGGDKTATKDTPDRPREQDDADKPRRSASQDLERQDQAEKAGEEEETELKTEAERRFAEAKRKRVCYVTLSLLCKYRGQDADILRHNS